MTTMSYVPKSDAPAVLTALGTAVRFLGNLAYATVSVVLLGVTR
jgi:hypothetical protein